MSQKSKDMVKQYFRDLGIMKGDRTYTSHLPIESRQLLNQRERNILDIHYGLLDATRPVQFRSVSGIQTDFFFVKFQP